MRTSERSRRIHFHIGGGRRKLYRGSVFTAEPEQRGSALLSGPVWATTTYNPQGEFTTGSSYTRNVPGQIYNSESEFIVNAPPPGAPPSLADYWTRLKATFHGVPRGCGCSSPWRTSLTQPATGTTAAMLVGNETAGDMSSPANFPALPRPPSWGHPGGGTARGFERHRAGGLGSHG